MAHEERNIRLYEKCFAEQKQYRERLLSLPPEEILNHAYEYTVREDILLALETDDLSDEQATALLSSPAPLDDVFHDFEQIEGDHMDLIRGCIETRADDILEAQREAILKRPVYKFPASYAKEHGETAEYRESFKTNIACKAAIEDAIARHYHDNRLDAACIEEVICRFGMERTSHVMAATLQDRAWDGRISPENKTWARGISIPLDQDAWGDNRTREYVVSRPHPGLLNLFATLVRKEQARERDSPENRPSVSAMLQKPAKTKALKPATKKSHEPEH